MNRAVYKILSVFILGFLLGASLTNAHIGSQVDNLSIANQTLQQELMDMQLKIQQQKEKSTAANKLTINSIETFLIIESTDELTDHDKMSLELECNKKVKEMLQTLIGQEISNIDSLLIPQIIDNREIEANGNKYKIKTNLIVLNKNTLVYLKASQIKTES